MHRSTPAFLVLLLALAAIPTTGQEATRNIESRDELAPEELRVTGRQLDVELRRVERQFAELSRGDTGTRGTELRSLERRLLDLAARAERLTGPWRERLDARIWGLRRQILFVESADPADGNWRSMARAPRSVDRSLPRAVVQPSDECASAPSVDLGVIEGSFLEATADGQATCSGYTRPDRWVRLAVDAAGWVTLRDSSSSLRFSVHDSCPGTQANTIACGAYRPLSWYAEAGRSYWIRLAEQYEEAPFDFELELKPSTGFAGTVTDLEGEPLAGVDVSAASGYDGAGDRTDEDGRYRILDLPPASYRVFTDEYSYGNNPNALVNEAWPAVPCPRACDGGYGEPIALAEGEVVEGIDFALGHGATLSGRLSRASNGNPASGFIVVYDGRGSVVRDTYTEVDGTWSFHTVPPGTAYVVAFSNEVYQLWDGIPCMDSDCELGDGTPIATEHGVEIDGVDFVVDDSVACVEDSLTVCIDSNSDQDRFRVTVRVASNEGQGVELWARHLETYSLPREFRGGILYFFDESNPEMLVKILDACGFNGHFWVFSAAATSLGYDLTIEDMVTGQTRTYTNSDGAPAATITDTEAFSCL